MANLLAVIKRQDWLLNFSILLLSLASLAIIRSISENLFWQQLLWFAVSFIVIIVFSSVDWRSFVNYRWFIWGIYGASVLLLIITFFLAPTIRQSKSWLVIGPVQFQTSEFAKVALIAALASFFMKQHVGIAHFSVLVKSFVFFLIPAGLILLQPDLGTVIILLGLWLGFLLVSGLRWRHIFIGFMILALLSAFGWFYFLKDYQKSRVVALFNADYDPLGVNYSVIQSKIAIGSAGFWGTGFHQGTQAQLGFLPESSTDFILAAFIEEWGLLGGMLVIFLFILLVFRIIRVGWLSENNFARLFCLGTAIMFLIQFIINTGSTAGLLPVIGVTFPFFSYGGSSILINAVLVSVVQSISARSKF